MPEELIPTIDPSTWIEEQREGYIRYVNLSTGERHEVRGICDRRGDCLIGAYVEGFGVVMTRRDIARAQKQLGRDRIDSELDVPVGPGFRGCCPLKVMRL